MRKLNGFVFALVCLAALSAASALAHPSPASVLQPQGQAQAPAAGERSPLSVPPIELTLPAFGNQAPEVHVVRDDRVATLDLDYVAGNPWTPFDTGADGIGPVGYRVSWWPQGDPANLSSKVTSLRRTQIQPLANNSPYIVRVERINRLGALLPGHAQGPVYGGSPARVAQLRAQMTGFFDDFNRPAGLPDELRWNTTFSRINDPALQAFFVNGQFHSHSLVGTPAQGFGDRGQTVHRVRTPLQIESGATRRIVFDLDGVDLASRTVWYLDLLHDPVDITSHFAIAGGPGFPGHPSPGLRFRLVGQSLSIWTLNGAGEQLLLAENNALDWSGSQTFPNVRRSFELQVTPTTASVHIDGKLELATSLGTGALAPGPYTVHWTAFGYNTMKVNLPYMLLHWDNFGFDGPAPQSVTHNYRSHVTGTDYVESVGHEPRTVEVPIPDALAPTSGQQAQAALHFTRQMATHTPAAWSPADSVTVNGQPFPIPAPVSAASPPLPISTLISANAPYADRIPLGPVASAPLVQGTNQIVFRASQCGFHNVHIEIHYPAGSGPPYTPPEAIHPVPMHHDFPRVGLPARITHIGASQVQSYIDDLNDPAVFQPTVSGTIEIGALVNGDHFNGPRYLRSNFTGVQLAGNGENPGIQLVEVRLRPDDSPPTSATQIGLLTTAADFPAPQVVHAFPLDTTTWPNGTYELTLRALDATGTESIPDYSHAGEAAGTPAALNGFDFPLHVRIEN